MRFRTIALATVLLAAAPAFAQKIYVGHDPNYDIDGIESFSWSKTLETSVEASAPLMHSHIVNAIEHYLSLGGIREVESDPDVFVTYHTSTTDTLILNAWKFPGYQCWGDVDCAIKDARMVLSYPGKDLAPDLPNVCVDAVQIQHVILNLVTNAFESMEGSVDGERILTIRTRRVPGDRVQVSVRDTGCGFAAGEIGQVFQPFYTTKEKGVGLGLAVSRSLVETHGGELSAATNPDRGACFNLTLPLGPEGQLNAGTANRIRRR